MSPSPAFQRIQQLFADEQCVLLDGGVGTELRRAGIKNHPLSDNQLWGTGALYYAPDTVLEVHRRYVEAQCDVITTNTWAILNAPELETHSTTGAGSPRHWLDAARLGIQLARQAVASAGQTGNTAVAFSINGDINSPDRQETIGLLARVLEESPPDLILMETLSLLHDNLYPAIQTILDTGLPVWLSFRRCRHGVCGVHGQHWGGPEGDLFGRAADRFEQMGVSALMINCLPADHVSGMIPWLRDFTGMPLGAYPNLGRYLDPGWKFDAETGPDQYANMASQWRSEGAQIVGGCCGVTPDHMAAVAKTLAGSRPGGRAVTVAGHDMAPSIDIDLPSATAPWLDQQGRNLYPLQMPDLRIEPGVFEPTEGSFLIWKHLYRNGTGDGQRCLDIGCGCGILTVQLALNGAEHVHAIDVQQEAAANTMANAYRNNVSDRVRAVAEDLYTFSLAERCDVIVASLYQVPVDPYGEVTGHRPVDFWGRNLVDHLISILPDLLAPGGVAYLMQLSILGQARTAQLLEAAGLQAKVIDFDTFGFGPVFTNSIEHIREVEQLSDAYHLTFENTEVMVAYLLEVTHNT